FGFSVMMPKTRKRMNREQHQERVEKNRAARNNEPSRSAGGAKAYRAGSNDAPKAGSKPTAKNASKKKTERKRPKG
ncbi:MAG: hypothetical protein ACI4LQ_03840, partial [Anaerovoracaceae bacterium]